MVDCVTMISNKTEYPNLQLQIVVNWGRSCVNFIRKSLPRFAMAQCDNKAEYYHIDPNNKPFITVHIW